MHQIMNKCVDLTKPIKNLHKQHLTIIVGVSSSSTPPFNFLLQWRLFSSSIRSPNFSFRVKIGAQEIHFMFARNISVVEKHENYAELLTVASNREKKA